MPTTGDRGGAPRPNPRRVRRTANTPPSVAASQYPPVAGSTADATMRWVPWPHGRARPAPWVRGPPGRPMRRGRRAATRGHRATNDRPGDRRQRSGIGTDGAVGSGSDHAQILPRGAAGLGWATHGLPLRRIQGVRHPGRRPRRAQRPPVPGHRRGRRPVHRRPHDPGGPRHARVGGRAVGGVLPGRPVRGRHGGRPRPRLHRSPLLRRRQPRRSRGHVHRLAQSGPVQRAEALPGGGPAHRPGHRPRRDPGHR